MLGEGQILAQVKAAHKLAQKYQGLGRLLDRLFKQAISAGKRVRSETSIGTGAVSISSAAVELAQTKVRDLAACRVTIIGAGKMSRLLVQHLLAKRAATVAIVNRSPRRATELANQFPEAQLQLYSLAGSGRGDRLVGFGVYQHRRYRANFGSSKTRTLLG